MMGNHGVGRVVRVAQDGSGHYLTVQAAIDAVPLCNTQRVVISIAAGVYRQPIYVPKTKNLITLQVKRSLDRRWGVVFWSTVAKQPWLLSEKLHCLRLCKPVLDSNCSRPLC
jgi:pectinesterase